MDDKIKWTKKTLAARAWFSAGRTFDFICPRCRATSITMTVVCNAPLEERCPGFEAVENAHQEFEKNYHAMINDATANFNEKGEGDGTSLS